MVGDIIAAKASVRYAFRETVREMVCGILYSKGSDTESGPRPPVHTPETGWLRVARQWNDQSCLTISIELIILRARRINSGMSTGQDRHIIRCPGNAYDNKGQ